jgi:hypothetical protein
MPAIAEMPATAVMPATLRNSKSRLLILYKTA